MLKQPLCLVGSSINIVVLHIFIRAYIIVAVMNCSQSLGGNCARSSNNRKPNIWSTDLKLVTKSLGSVKIIFLKI